MALAERSMTYAWARVQEFAIIGSNFSLGVAVNNTIVHPSRISAVLPTEVVDVFNHFFTAELTTLGRRNAPITWPVMPIFWAQRGEFVVLTSIGLPQKAFNIRRNPQVSLLFSYPMGSELVNPPAVLVQGTAAAPDEIFVSLKEADPELLEVILLQTRKMIQRQPAMALYMSSPITRYLMDWYFMRLMISITPHTIHWWPGGDFSIPPQCLELFDVD